MGEKIAILAQGLWKSFPLKASSLFGLWLGRDKKIPSFDALKNVSLAVPQGEMLGVLGANGAGKSTLLCVLAGIYTPDKGSVTIAGDLAGLFELGGMGNLHLTGREYARRYLSLYHVPEDRRAQVMEEIMEFSELGTYFDRQIRTYSSGMAARLYFSTVTAIPCSTYLIDEILSVGDEHFQVKSWARMRDRLSSGASGILVTHDWSAVIKLCRNASVLQRGKVTREGAADKVVTAYLQLPVPDSSLAQIHPPEQFHAVCGEALRLEFEVNVTADIEVEAAVSIEYLRLGVGWEIVVISEYLPVAHVAGRYRVRMEMPYTPMQPGDYIVNIFLSRPPDPADSVRQSLHVFSWTHGNGLPLTVTGEPRQDLAPFPVAWRQAAV